MPSEQFFSYIILHFHKMMMMSVLDFLLPEATVFG